MNLFDQLNAIAPSADYVKTTNRNAANEAKHKQMVDFYRSVFGSTTLTAVQFGELTNRASTTVNKKLLLLEKEGCVKQVGKVKGMKTVLWQWIKGK